MALGRYLIFGCLDPWGNCWGALGARRRDGTSLPAKRLLPTLEDTGLVRGPKDHRCMRILPTTVSGIPLMLPKGSMYYMVYTWPLKGLPNHYLRACVYTIKLHEALGLGLKILMACWVPIGGLTNPEDSEPAAEPFPEASHGAHPQPTLGCSLRGPLTESMVHIYIYIYIFV